MRLWRGFRDDVWPVIAPGLVVAMALAIGVNFWLLIPALDKLKTQSQQGAMARERQCLLAPVALKLYTEQYREGVISRADLRLLQGGLPARCLK